MKPRFFCTQESFRKWLQQNHKTATELVVGFYKVHTGKASITWPESVDVALCFGWIDGMRTSIDVDSYQIRFTPRKPGSIWSAVNIKKVIALAEQGLMQSAGLECFEQRDHKKSRLYSHENDLIPFSPEFEKQFKANKTAWKYYQSLAPSYRKSSNNWVMGAKQEATRLKRLSRLITDCASGINQWKDNKYTGK